MAGLVGAGRSEIAQACFGMTPPSVGQRPPQRRRGSTPRTPEADAQARACLSARGSRRPGADHARDRSSTTSRCRSSAGSPISASSTAARSAASPRGDQDLRRARDRHRSDRLAAVRRQSPEGRLRQMAGDRADRRSSSTSRPTASTSARKAQVHRIIAKLADSGPGHPGHLVRPAGSAGHQRPDPGHRRRRARRRARSGDGDAGNA